MSCRTAKSLVKLKAEIKALFPDRDDDSDGGCASPDHSGQNPNSDHEPNAKGVARAYDLDEDLHSKGHPAPEMMVIAEHIRRMGEYGDHRLVSGDRNGYVIYERRIAGAGKGWAWRPYTGPNAHDHHMHVSVCSNEYGYDDGTTPWHIADLFQGDDMPLNQEDKDWIYNVVTERIKTQLTTEGQEVEQHLRDLIYNIATERIKSLVPGAGDD